MPTHEEYVQFMREYLALPRGQRRAFLKAMRQMVEDLQARRPLRARLRIKRVQGYAGIFEMTWAGDGRATFEYGVEQIPGEQHIIWRRIGGHDILKQP
jgi:hypothetical protein